MPRLAPIVVVGFFNVAVAGGCWFSADYRSGNVACRDDKCPSGLTCVDQVCVVPTGDGAGSNVHDARMPDGKPDAFEMAALTCADPGTFVADNTVSGSTVAPRTNTISASCNGTVMNGNDAVYKIAGTGGQHVTLTPHSTAYPVAAYLIAPCTGFPTCISNVFATDSTPAMITLGADGDYFIVVDGINPTQSGAYTLTVTLN